PFFSSSFCALMTGGRNAPSEGGPNTTMESGSGGCAHDAPDDSNTPTHARPAKYLFMIPSRNLFSLSFALSSQAKQTLRQAAIDGGALRIRELGLGDNFCRREIADRERHVRTHHDPVSADDVGK